MTQLTGRIFVRQSLLGRPVLQVETVTKAADGRSDYDARDAVWSDLNSPLLSGISAEPGFFGGLLLARGGEVLHFAAAQHFVDGWNRDYGAFKAEAAAVLGTPATIADEGSADVETDTIAPVQQANPVRETAASRKFAEKMKAEGLLLGDETVLWSDGTPEAPRGLVFQSGGKLMTLGTTSSVAERVLRAAKVTEPKKPARKPAAKKAAKTPAKAKAAGKPAKAAPAKATRKAREPVAA